MTQRHHISLIGAVATILAAFPLTTVFATWNWMFYSSFAIAMVVGSAMLVRLLRGPVWVQVVVMVGALLLFLTWAFPSGQELLGFLPSGGTFHHFGTLLGQAGNDIREQSAPVPDLDSLLLLTTGGVGSVAIMVDLFAVGLRRPALAGLPMLAIYSVPVAILPTSVSLVTFVVGASGFLWLLVTDSIDRVRRFGRRFTGDGRDVDLWEPSPLASAGRRLGIVSVAIAVLLPLAIPGMTSGLLDRFNGGGLGGDGGSGGSGGPPPKVNLNALIGSGLSRDKAFYMVRVTTDDPAPYYLRFGIADQPAEDGFHNRTPTGGAPVTDGIEQPKLGTSITPSYTANVQILNFDMNLAPIYEYPVNLNGLGSDWFYDPDSSQVYSRNPKVTTNRKSYSFDYVHASYPRELLRQAPPIPANDQALASLTFVPPVKYVQDIVDDLVVGRTTEYDKVNALYHYFDPANGFTYSIQLKPGKSGNAIIDFLSSKHGFCVQYAASLAWMVRAAGFPSRVAFGFTGGGTPIQNTYALTNFDLHAWTEVYFPTMGWVPFDATPASSIEGARSTPWAPSLGVDTSGPNSEDPDLQKKNSASATPTPSTAGGTGTGPTGGGLFGGWAIWVLAGVGALALLVLIALAPALRRSALRRRRRSRSGATIVLDPGGAAGRPGVGPPVRALIGEFVLDPGDVVAAQHDAHAAWAELLDLMIDFNILVDDSETPRATASRVAAMIRREGPASADAVLLGRAEERARYARTPLRPDRFDAAVAGVRRAFLLGATRRERMSAAILPRSVLLRWRANWTYGLAATVNWFGGLRDRVVRLASPRRLLPGRASR
jgi:transglutaminase-like putative cysteine protease